MTTEPKRRAFTAEDVRAAYEAGTEDGRRAGPSGAHRWHTHTDATWHPDNPENRVTEPEWRKDAPEAGRWVERPSGLTQVIKDHDHALAIHLNACRVPSMYAWRYIDPPTTTSEDSE